MRLDLSLGLTFALTISIHGHVLAEEPAGGKPSAPSESEPAPPIPEFIKLPIPIEGDFVDGWKQTIPIDSPITEGESVTLWIEDGWLAARRNSASGAVDWQLYLCPIDEVEEPMISVKTGMPYFEVTYGDGHYFIRDSSYILHCRRLPKLSGKLMQQNEMVGEDVAAAGTASSINGKFAGIYSGDWYHVVAGPEYDRWNLFVRLNPNRQGSGVRVGLGLTHWQHGDTWLIDDGEFTVATRTLEALYLAEKEERAKRAAKESPPEP